MNNYIFTYQHTCKKGQVAYILHNAAFKSVTTPLNNGNKVIPFLGEGYYYWEENIAAAHRWGNHHYKGIYNIVEYEDCEIETEFLLDFLNRRDLQFFNELRNKYIQLRPKCAEWKIGVWIEFFKKLNTKSEEMFPFLFFRADENYPDEKENHQLKKKHLFGSGGYYLYLDPLIILCCIDKRKFIYKSKKLVA